ncbi:hypothetical protein B0T24DRAFT_695448 [Lasiosphaeria ovina]|uniref:Uncharacterized protein n=1 Tax=Lasiosphaeria ovina TaxID=92902 RepID=A0AAE0NDR6_9PEZI|nr:hypothetical protein B0T24DRAFT_695448 [Lasiosphaeria ovina]
MTPEPSETPMYSNQGGVWDSLGLPSYTAELGPRAQGVVSLAQALVSVDQIANAESRLPEATVTVPLSEVVDVHGNLTPDSPGPWEMIARKLGKLYKADDNTLEQSPAGVDARNRRRTRPKKAAPKFKAYGIVALPSRWVPVAPSRPLLGAQYEIQERLFLSIDHYVKGFFDAASTSTEAVLPIVQNSRAVQQTPKKKNKVARAKRQQRMDAVVREVLDKRVVAEFATIPCSPHMLVQFWNLCRNLRGISVQVWGSNAHGHVYIHHCIKGLLDVAVKSSTSLLSGMVPILERLLQVRSIEKKDMAAEEAKKKTKQKRKEKKKEKAKEKANDKTKEKTKETRDDILRNKAENRKRNKEVKMKESWMKKITGGKTDGKSEDETKDTLERAFKCTADSLSTRLGGTHPLILGARADFYHHWDDKALSIDRQQTLFEEYKQVLAEMEQRYYDQTDDRMLQFLSNYAATAYYIGRDNDLAIKLASDLWDRTRDWDGNAWTIKAQCMVDAALILGTVYSSPSGIHRMTREQMYELQKSMGYNTRGKRGRKEWRRMFNLPPPPDSLPFAQVVGRLHEASERPKDGVLGWNWDLAVASLSDQLLRFSKRSEESSPWSKLAEEEAELEFFDDLAYVGIRRG